MMATNNITNLNMIGKTPSQQSSDNQSQWLPAKDSVSDHEGIWGYRFFTHGDRFEETGEGSPWNTEYLPPSTKSNLVNNRQLSYDILNCYEFDEMYLEHQLDHDWRQAIIDSPGYADVTLIPDILKGETCLQNVDLIYTLQSFVYALMVDNYMFGIFEELVDSCNDKHLDSLVGTILLGHELFISAVFREQGAKSIVKLITKLKKSSQAFTMTKVLSTRFFDIVTDNSASRVIQQCFILFGHEPNKILYERTIHHCYDMATHKVGCKSLNECINTISGEQRSTLLSCIADVSDFLSIDPYGNHVVQNCLDLGDHDVTSRILSVLKGHHVKLAQHKVGSNVVDKCMECSEIGLMDVVNEILMCPTTPLLLAQVHFGNYVIRTALRKTKECGFKEMHESLAKSLEGYHNELSRTMAGRDVIELIEELVYDIVFVHV